MRIILYHILFIFFFQTFSALGQTAKIPDPNLLSFIKTNYPSTINSSNELIISKAAAVTGVFDCSNSNISNMEGIQYFTGITTLDIDDNNITSINQISSLTTLQTLRFENNYLTGLPNLSKLTNLKVLVAYDNDLKSLPDLSNNTQLNQLVFNNNQLTVLPDLSKLINLHKLEVSNNLLQTTPDLSANVQLTTLALEKNLLTVAPGLSNLPNLTSVKLYSNAFSFEDLVPYSSYPGFSTIFEVSPQKKLAGKVIEVVETGSLVLTTGIDTSISNMTYTWYYNGKLLRSVSNDSLIISPVSFANEGTYYCILTNPAIPGLEITTDNIEVDVVNCPVIGNISFEYSEINCLNTGKVKINMVSVPSQQSIFYLCSPVFHDTLVSEEGYFEGLKEPAYILRVKIGPVCYVTLKDTLKVPYDECEEAFITPDGDSDKDRHYFSRSGTAVIYDRNGNVVHTLTIPGEWDGSSKHGPLVAPGYYSAVINKGEKVINISVLY